jgi:hypothetical protein
MLLPVAVFDPDRLTFLGSVGGLPHPVRLTAASYQLIITSRGTAWQPSASKEARMNNLLRNYT